MAISATLTTSASGNEMPGYPRVSSVPPHSLSCNGYPGLNEYGGSSTNSSVNSQAITNTSSSQTVQMHPPLTQSPGHQQPSRPNSSNTMYQQQSPSHYHNNNNNNHMSPRSQTHSPLNHQSTNGGSSAQHNLQASRLHISTSNHSTEGQHDWNQNSWDQQQSNVSFNQSERINLNTRLKTMILNKNEKEQQQSSTNHFLSYSHQHLSEQQSQLANNKSASNDLNSNAEKKFSETGDVGGSEMDDSWKSPITKQSQEDNKNEENFTKKQQTPDKDSRDSCREKEFKSSQKSSREADSKAADSQPAFNNNPFDQHHQQQMLQTTTESMNKEVTKKDESGSDIENEKQSYSYHSAHEYQQHKNMVNTIKKEPLDVGAAGSVKYEGYEKNYQNFIRYADFCDAQQPQYDSHQKQSVQQDFGPSQGYYNNYPYQNYAPTSQNYAQPHSQSYQQFMSQAAYQNPAHHHPHPSSSLTNFEQQIPLHTYPIPKNPMTGIGEMVLPSTANIKSEPIFTNSLHSSPLLSENMPRVEKEESKHYPQQNEELNEQSCDLLPLQEEVS